MLLWVIDSEVGPLFIERVGMLLTFSEMKITWSVFMGHKLTRWKRKFEALEGSVRYRGGPPFRYKQQTNLGLVVSTPIHPLWGIKIVSSILWLYSVNGRPRLD